jgi:hypothetical protein
MKRFASTILISLITLVGVVLASPLVASPVGAIDVFKDACKTGAGSTGTNAGTGVGSGATGTTGGTGSSSSSSLCGATKTDEAPAIIKNVINTILIVLGMIAVVMIVIGGIRYTTSNGDASGVKGAKDTILYAVVGLVVAILAYAIVNFILARFAS